MGSVTVITAPAGFGKTALLAALVSTTPMAFAYHFFTALYDNQGLSEIFFLRNVVGQMTQWYGYNEPLPSDVHELRALYHRLLDMPSEGMRVLVLDGLDEVTTWDLAPYLSRRLPDNMHFVVSVRDVGQDWATQYQFPRSQLQHLALRGLGRDEVAAVLRAVGAKGAVFAENQALLEEIVELTRYGHNSAMGADPFYTRLLAEDVEAGKIAEHNLEAQPTGLENYLGQWWKQLATSIDRQPIADLLSTLAITFGPISRADLEALNPSLVHKIRRRYFDDIVNQVRRWVLQVDEGYSLVHPRLQQYLQKELRTEPYHDNLIEYSREWAQHQSQYALTYFVRHLASAGKLEELVATVTDLNYIVTKSLTRKSPEVESELWLAERCVPENETIRLLRKCYRQCAHLLDACNLRSELAITFISRLWYVEGLSGLTEALDATIPRPYLRPYHALPDVPDTSMIRTLRGHSSEVWSCAVNSAGTIIVSASFDRTLKVWDAVTGIERHTLRGHTANVTSCAISADGEVIISASADGTVKVWDASIASERYTLSHKGEVLLGLGVRSCAISGDGRVVASACGRTVKLWDATTGSEYLTFKEHTEPVTSCTISADGSIVASTSWDGTIKVWNSDDGCVRHSFQVHGTDDRWYIIYGTGRLHLPESALTCCAISANQKLIVAGARDGNIRVWDLEEGLLLYQLHGHAGPVRGCALTKDSKYIITVAEDGFLRVWDVESGKLHTTYYGHSGPLLGCTVDDEHDLLVSASADWTLRIWHRHNAEKITSPNIHRGDVTGCDISGDGRTAVSTSSDRTLKIWDVLSGGVRHTLFGDTQDVSDCSLSPDGEVVATVQVSPGRGRDSIKVWDAVNGKQRLSIDRLDFSAQYTDLRNGSRAYYHQGDARCAIGANGTSIACTSSYSFLKELSSETRNMGVNVINGEDGTLRFALLGHTDHVCDSDISADGNVIVSASWDKTLGVWDGSTGNLIHSLQGHTSEVILCAISANGKVIASQSWDDGAVKIWDAESGELLFTLDEDMPRVRSFAISGNGELIVSASADKKLRIWDVHSRSLVTSIQLDSFLYACSCSDTGEWVVGGGGAGIFFFRLVS